MKKSLLKVITKSVLMLSLSIHYSDAMQDNRGRNYEHAHLSQEAQYLVHLTDRLEASFSAGNVEVASLEISQFIAEGLDSKGIPPHMLFHRANLHTQSIIEDAICVIEKFRMTSHLPFIKEYLRSSNGFSSNLELRTHQEIIYLFACVANLSQTKTYDNSQLLISDIVKQSEFKYLTVYRTQEQLSQGFQWQSFLRKLQFAKKLTTPHLFSGDARKVQLASPALFSMPTNKFEEINLSDRILIFSDHDHSIQKEKWKHFLSSKQMPTYANPDLSQIHKIAPVLQHTAAFISKREMPNTVLGTQNVMYCVNATIHNPHDELSGMAHLDIHTNIDSLNPLLEKVRNGRPEKDMVITLISSFMSDRLVDIDRHIDNAGYSVKYVDVSYSGTNNRDTSYMTLKSDKFVFIYPYKYCEDFKRGTGIFHDTWNQQRNIAMTAGNGTLFHIPTNSPFHQPLEKLESTLYDAYSLSRKQNSLDRNLLNLHMGAFRNFLKINPFFVPNTSVYEIANLMELDYDSTPLSKVKPRDNKIFYNKKLLPSFPYFRTNLVYALNFNQGQPSQKIAFNNVNYKASVFQADFKTIITQNLKNGLTGLSNNTLNQPNMIYITPNNHMVINTQDIQDAEGILSLLTDSCGINNHTANPNDHVTLDNANPKNIFIPKGKISFFIRHVLAFDNHFQLWIQKELSLPNN